MSVRAASVVLLLRAAIAWADEPVTCKVGLHVVALSQIDIAARAADAELYWWIKCPRGTAPEAMNLSLTASGFDPGEPLKEDAGEVSYQSQRLRAQPRVPLSLRDDPFGEQRVCSTSRARGGGATCG